jgi:hypothetical protein
VLSPSILQLALASSLADLVVALRFPEFFGVGRSELRPVDGEGLRVDFPSNSDGTW